MSNEPVEVSRASQGSTMDDTPVEPDVRRKEFYLSCLQQGYTTDQLKAFYVLSPEFAAEVSEICTKTRKYVEEHPDGIELDKLPKLTRLERMRDLHQQELIRLGISE